ncbi:MAG: glutaredoxin domain-containing protein [Burkholderiaceae bacterium]
MNNLKTNSSAARPTRVARLASVALLLGGVTVGALAQYKIVGPDGQVTYTDKPPTAAAIRPSKGTPAQPGSTGLPYETRNAMGKYPVTLYATKSCPGCDQARQALKQRGVPFTEFSVGTDADLAAFLARFGSTLSPVIVIGNQSMKGYSPNDLSSYLDAAGYPAQAHLSGYSWPPATPLAPRGTVAPAATAAAGDSDDPVPAAAPPAPLLPPPSNSGIQF